jgi:hypothetical protein
MFAQIVTSLWRMFKDFTSQRSAQMTNATGPWAVNKFEGLLTQ